MKKILVLAVMLSLSTVACNAFQDSYGNEGALSPNNAGEPPLPPQQPTNNPGDAPVDYSVDKTECNAIAEIKVVKSETVGSVTGTVLTGAGAKEGDKLTTVAKKIGAYTNMISIRPYLVLYGDKDVLLSFTLKQTGEKEFSVCSVVYGDKKVKSGELTVDRFNDFNDDATDITKAVNSGEFEFEFEVSVDVSTAIKILAGDELATSSTETVKGSYFDESFDRFDENGNLVGVYGTPYTPKPVPAN